MVQQQRDDVTIRYGADDSVFQRTTKRVLKTGQDLGGAFGRLGEQIGSIFGSVRGGAATGITAIASSFTLLAKSSLDSADALAKTADRIGITTDDLQALRFAAGNVGVEERVLDTALQRFSRRLGEASVGTGQLFETLQRLGIELRNQRDGTMRPMIDVLSDYADAIAAAQSTQEKLQLTVAGFDTEAAGLVNLFREGSEGMERYKQAAIDLGLVLDRELLDRAQVINQQWSDLWSQFTTRIQRSVLLAVDLISPLEKQFASVAEVEGELVKKRDELIEKQNALDKAGSRHLETTLREQIKGLHEEIAALDEKKAAMEKVIDVQKELTDETRRAQEEQARNARQQPEPSGRPFRSAELPQLQPGERFQPTPDQLGDALARFRAGEISATELGRLSGLQPHDIPEPRPGAFGTASNTIAGLPGVAESGIVQLAPDISEFSQLLRRSLSEEEFIVKVRPVIVDDSSAATVLVDRFGGSDT